ncbi:MAG TPA: ABC transporter permease [Dehalococcoidia bacterium]|nr:ABC transporter permease [Dehalococcoidia bacterium]
MLRYLLWRLLLNLLVLLVVASLVFLALRLSPGEVLEVAAQGAQGDPQQAREAVRRSLGLDRPLWEQYWDYLSDLARGDLGRSFRTRSPVLEDIGERIGPSLELGLLQLAVALLVGVPVGVVAAVRRDTWADYVLRGAATFLLGVPAFVLAVFALLASSRYLGWTPPITAYRDLVPFPPFDTPAPEDPWANLQVMALPALIGGLGTGAIVMRFLRSQMLEVLGQDYIRTAWAKGLAEQVVVMRHALRNALLPVVTVAGLVLGTLVAGNVVLEAIFLIPGLGLYAVNGVRQNDYPVVQGMTLLVASFLVFVNLLVDVVYAWLDPRVRYA